MSASDQTCICRQLVDLGLVDTLKDKPENERFLVAIKACMARSTCAPFDIAPASQSHAQNTPERRGGDRRSGRDRRQTQKAMLRGTNRRSGKERRSGGDRRGLTAGESYTHDQTLRNLQAWCADKCQGQYKLWLSEGADKSLRFRFELDSDRDRFLAMLKNFKKPG